MVIAGTRWAALWRAAAWLFAGTDAHGRTGPRSPAAQRPLRLQDLDRIGHSCRNPIMDRREHIRWFAREILPHEADVRRWLTRKVRGLADFHVDEIVQEAYARLWAVSTDRIANARAYFFVTVRNIVAEQLRRSRVVSIETIADVDTLNIPDGDGGPERRLSGREEIEQLERLLAQLPPKCREVFELRKFSELSQREIAERLQVSESTVEKHLVKAVRFVMREMKKARREEHLDSGNGHEQRHKKR
jgi:RNA polymerase sigma factor (sigma-70 family)